MAKIFYYINIPDNEIRSCIDFMTFLFNENEKWSAHITVRGPYKQRLNSKWLDSYNSIIAGKSIYINGSGSFFSSAQNTVYFNCEGIELEKIWNKTNDGYGYHPHITIYDGGSRSLAKRILVITKHYSYNLPFKARGLDAINLLREQLSMNVKYSIDMNIIRKIVGDRIDITDVSAFSIQRKMDYTDLICQYLSELSKYQNRGQDGNSKTATICENR